MEAIIIHPKNRKQSATIEAILKALDVSFKKEEDFYNPEFVAMVLESKKQVEEGNYITLDPSKSLWENIL